MVFLWMFWVLGWLIFGVSGGLFSMLLGIGVKAIVLLLFVGSAVAVLALSNTDKGLCSSINSSATSLMSATKFKVYGSSVLSGAVHNSLCVQIPN